MDWRYRNTVLVVTSAALFSTVVARLAISPVVPAIIVDLGASKSQLGAVLTGMWAAYAVFQLPGGILAEWFDERRVILLALALTGLGSVLLAGAPELAAFAVVAVFLGAGSGLYFTAGSTLLTRSFRNTGQALGFHEAGASLAGLLAPVAAAAVAVRFGWRAALLLGLVTAPVFVLVLIALRPAGSFADPPRRARWRFADLRAVIEDPAVAYTLALAVACAFVWQGVASFFPTFLIEQRGLPIGRASLLFGSIFAVATVSLPLVGRLSDAFSRDAALGVALSLGAIGLGLSLVGPGPVGPVVGAVLVGAGFGWPAALQSRFMDHFGDGAEGVSFGLVRSLYLLLGATGSLATGALADEAGWPAAVGALAALFVLATASLAVNRLVRLGW